MMQSGIWLDINHAGHCLEQQRGNPSKTKIWKQTANRHNGRPTYDKTGILRTAHLHKQNSPLPSKKWPSYGV